MMRPLTEGKTKCGMDKPRTNEKPLAPPTAPTPQREDLEYSLYCNLLERYTDMSKGTKSEDKINAMMCEVVHNLPNWPKDKIGRWVGYVQCLLIEVEDVTTTKAERDYTRPLFHELYAAVGYEIPASVEV